MNVKTPFTRGWLSWLLVVLAMVIGTFHRSALTIVASRVTAELKLTGFTLGMLGSVFFWVYTAMQVPAGYFTDHIGPRLVVTVGLLLVGSGGILFSLGTSLFIAGIGRFLLGMGSAVFFLSLVRLQANWFSATSFATLTGLAAFLADGGGLLAGTPFAYLVGKLGWRIAYATISFVTLITAALTWFIVRNQPDYAAFEHLARTQEPVRLGHALKSITINPTTWPPFVAVLGLNSTLLTFQGVWSVPYLSQVYGLGPYKCAAYPSIMAVGLMLGGLISGYLADTLRHPRRVLVMFLSGYTAVWTTFVFFSGKPPETFLLPLAFLIGFFPGSMILAITCAKDANPPELSALAASVVNTGNFISVALLQPFVGWILDRWSGGAAISFITLYPLPAYFHMFLVYLALSFISLIGSLLIRDQ